MQLIVILLATVSVLTFLSGAIVFFGASKGDKIRSAWYFIAAIFATIWMASIAVFLTADTNLAGTIDWHVNWTFASALFLDTAFLGYAAWKKRFGKIATLFFLILAIVIASTIMLNPTALYSNINLSHVGNSVTMHLGPLYFAYIAFFGLIVPVIVITYLRQYLNTSSKRKRGGDLVTMLSFGISSSIVLVANLILPLTDNWSLIWLGPLALAATIIGVYYTILRYKMLNLASIWLRVFSYIVILSSIAMVYMIIFSVIFAALFRGSTPSTEVIILNFIMILVFLALMPALNGVMRFVQSLLSREKPEMKGNIDE
ncbi:hypothetical protein IJH23_00740 [Candidatus Saccharibacteria bacterium]|nr:hypothetical protein [Candidatus Saccharibacteria bacterium]